MPIRRDAAVGSAARQEGEVMLREAMVFDFNARPSVEQTFYPMQLQVRGF